MSDHSLPAPEVLLEVSTRGKGTLMVCDRPVRLATRHATCALLWLCTAAEKRLAVDEVAPALWPTAAESRLGRRLATMTWQIRRGLEEAAHLVERTPEALRIDAAGVRVNVLEARFAAQRALTNGRPIPEWAVEELSAEHCTPFAEMAWVVELNAVNAELLAR